MRDLVIIRMKSMFAGFLGQEKKGNSKGKLALVGILTIYIIGCFGVLFFNLFSGAYTALTGIGMEWLYFGVMGLMIFALCFVGSVFVTQQQIFEAKDNDLLLSMPVPVRNILVSRLLSIVLLNYIYELLIAGPGVAVYLYKGSVNPVGLFFALVTFLILPLLVMTCSVLFGWIIALIDAKIGGKNLIMMILTLLLMLVYLLLCFQLQEYMEKLIAAGEAIGEAIQKALPPFYHMGIAISEGSIMSFAFFLLLCFLPFGAVYLALSKSFIKIATANKGRKRAVYKAGGLKSVSVKQALFLKDLRHFAGNPLYIFNAAFGLLVMPLGAAYLFFKAEDMQALFRNLELVTGMENMTGCALSLGFALMASMTVISAPMISIEAKTLWISKALPVQTKDVIFAKANVHIAVSLPFILISVLPLEFVYDLTLFGRIILVVFPIVTTVFGAYMGLALNLLYPKFDWLNEMDAIKQGLAPTLAIFIATLSIVFPALIYMLLVKNHMSVQAYMGAAAVIFVLISLSLNRYLAKKGVALFEAL